MATFSLNGGVNEREPTAISDSQPQDCDGAEYRVGQPGIYVARGRDQIGDVGGVTNKSLYEAGFDGANARLIVHEGNSLHSAEITSSTLSFDLIHNLPSGSSAAVGCHYANRHYLATNVENRKLELIGAGVTASLIGMSASTFTVGVSATQGSGSLSSAAGLEYWATEYDSTRGIESIYGSTANTGAISSVDSVVVSVTGDPINPNANQIRWYRSTDGGAYPDGGLIQTTSIATRSITDTNTATATLTVPQYGIISVGGLETARDEAPPVLATIFGPFQDSLLGVAANEPRVLRYTPAGFVDSWPSAYGIPLETERRDEIVTGVVLPGRIGVFCQDSVHVVYRLPRDSDSIFAAGEAQDVLTNHRGCVSRRGATKFTPVGSGAIAAWVSRDGIWASDLVGAPVPLTDLIDWETRVDVANLRLCRLVDDPINRRLVFIHRKKSDTTHNTGVWYLDYQQFGDIGIRVTFADHGPLVDGATVAATDGNRRLVSADSRSGNGQIYMEANQDVDDSLLRDASGSVRFRVRTKEFLPGGPRASVALGAATWMHDAGPAKIRHRFFWNRRGPETKDLPESTIRTASNLVLGRNVNSVALELESSGTKSYGVHWVDVEGLDATPLGNKEHS